MKFREFRRILRADLAVNQEPLSRLVLFTFRFGQYAISRRNPLLRTAWRLLDLLYVQLLIGAELPPVIECGPGLTLFHAGRGVIIHHAARIGAGVTLYHRVTIGQRGAGVPVLRDRVYVGTGASILGSVKIGDDARIGAGAVVTRDVPAGHTARGVPAVIYPPAR